MVFYFILGVLCGYGLFWLFDAVNEEVHLYDSEDE